MRLLFVLVWPALAVLVVVAGLRLRKRPGGRRAGVELDDDAIRRIEREGVFAADHDEPLDLDEIAEEERRFWEEERWDRADEGF